MVPAKILAELFLIQGRGHHLVVALKLGLGRSAEAKQKNRCSYFIHIERFKHLNLFNFLNF